MALAKRPTPGNVGKRPSPSTAAKWLRANDARVNTQAKPLASALERWLKKYQELAIKDAEKLVRSGKVRLKKSAEDDLAKELHKLLVSYGLKQIERTGKDTVQAVAGPGGEWVLRPALIDAILREKEVKVQNITRSINGAVRGIIRRTLADAAKMDPRPSAGELARMIRTNLQDVYAFSPERAMLVARTETVQTENTAIHEGLKLAGIKKHRWLARRDGKSGTRHHERMHNQVRELGEPFYNEATREKLRYPGDPLADISETANCRCTVAPVIEKRT